MATSPGLVMYYEYRREWLWRLLKERFDDNQSEFSRAIDAPSRNTINDFLTARRSLSERIARRIEEKLGLDTGSLDKEINLRESKRVRPKMVKPGPKPKQQHASIRFPSR